MKYKPNAVFKVVVGERAIRRAFKDYIQGKSKACPNDHAVRPIVKKRGLPWKFIKTINNFLCWFDSATRENCKLPVPPNVQTFLTMYDKGEVIDANEVIHVNDIRYRIDPKKAIRTPVPVPAVKPKVSKPVVPLTAEQKKRREETRKRLAAQANGIRRFGIKGYDARRNLILKPEYREAVA